MDILALEGMEFFANHGYYSHEKENGGNYEVDVFLNLDLQKAGLSDDLEDTVNYETIYAIVEEVMNDSKNLIEHIAYQIVEQIALQFTEIESVRVKVTKLLPPLKGKVQKSTVELHRDIQDLKPTDGYWEERAKY